MKYKVGDRVRVRAWEDMVLEFGTDASGDICIETPEKTEFFDREMREYCRGMFTVSEAGNGRYELAGAERIECWVFSDSMLEDAELRRRR